MKSIFIIIIALMLPLIIKADQPRHSFSFTSSNSKYELRLNPASSLKNWELIESTSGKLIYQLSGDGLYSMTVLISDDGNHVVAIDDYSEREAARDLNVISFFDKGNLVKNYSLAEINGVEAISHSVSHFSWVWLNENASISESKLNIKTFALTNYTFDIPTGNILKRERDSVLSENAIYAYGEIVRKINDNTYEMEVCTLVQGTVSATGKIQFESNEPYIYVKSYRTVIVKNGKLVKAKTPHLLNSCNYASDRDSEP